MNLSVAAYSDPGTDAHLVSFLFVGDVALNESSPERLCDALCGAVQCDAETCERHARFERIDLGVDARGAPQTRVRAETVVLCVREPRCFYAVNALRGAGSDLQLLDRAFREEVPEEEETFPIGRSVIAREGKDLTLIAYGAMMRPTLDAADELKRKHGVEADVIDLLTISPLDDSLLVASARKTGRVAVVHEAPRSFGPGAEVVARLVEKAFFHLEAPVARVTGYDVIIPLFSREKYYLPGVPRIIDAARKLLAA